MTLKLDIHINQGADFQHIISLVDDDGNDIVFSDDDEASSAMRHSFISDHNYTEIDCELANGSLTLSLSANTTSNCEFGRYVWDTKITYANNYVERIAEGIATVYPSAE